MTLEVRGRLGLRGFQRLERGSSGLVKARWESDEARPLEVATLM